jgi:Tfp pilus assembly protein PilF
MKRYYCTYFDRNYLFRAIALMDSLRQHEPDFTLFAVCIDGNVHRLLKILNLPNIVAVPLHDIEQGDEALLAAKNNRSQVEYYFTLTPTIILRLLERYPKVDVITYVDADLFFFSSPDPIYHELGNGSVLIHEHRFSPSEAHKAPLYGTYNVGLLCFRHNQEGLTVLKWWRERCLEWCYNRAEDGKYADQGYLNDWPQRFKGVVVLAHKGCGVALWNHEQYQYKRSQTGQVLVDDTPLIFYHFSALQMVFPNIIVPDKYGTYPRFCLDAVEWILMPYINSLFHQISQVRTVWPDFTYGLKENITVTEVHDFIAADAMVDKIELRNESHRQIPMGDGWNFYQSMIPLKRVEDEKIRGNHDKAPAQKLSRKAKVNRDAAAGSLPEVVHNAMTLLLAEGHTQAACWVMERLREEYPNNEYVINGLAALAYHRGEDDKALKYYQRAAEMAPGNAFFQKDLGDFYLVAQHCTESALHQYMKVLALNGDEEEVLVKAGHLSVSLHRFEDARRYYLRAQGIAPERSDVVMYLKKLNSHRQQRHPEV